MFLAHAGFVETEAAPTLVRFVRGDVEVDVFHGRKSYEIDAGVTFKGTRFSLSEIVRVTNPLVVEGYRSAVATSPDSIAASLAKLSAMLRQYGGSALCGDRTFFSKLKEQRVKWSEDYAIEVLAEQLRPKAEDAFRRGDYAAAAELYLRIRHCLSQAEIAKLTIASKRIEK